MSDNWVVQNLQNALDTWNSKTGGNLADHYPVSREFQRRRHLECDRQYPRCAAGNRVCPSGVFFVVGVVKTCGSFTEVKKPEQTH